MFNKNKIINTIRHLSSGKENTKICINISSMESFLIFLYHLYPLFLHTFPAFLEITNFQTLWRYIFLNWHFNIHTYKALFTRLECSFIKPNLVEFWVLVGCRKNCDVNKFETVIKRRGKCKCFCNILVLDATPNRLIYIFSCVRTTTSAVRQEGIFKLILW